MIDTIIELFVFKILRLGKYVSDSISVFVIFIIRRTWHIMHRTAVGRSVDRLVKGCSAAGYNNM